MSLIIWVWQEIYEGGIVVREYNNEGKENLYLFVFIFILVLLVKNNIVSLKDAYASAGVGRTFAVIDAFFLFIWKKYQFYYICRKIAIVQKKDTTGKY